MSAILDTAYTEEYMASLKAYPEEYETLEADIAHYRAMLRKDYSPVFLKGLDQAIVELKQKGYFENRLRVGDQAPEFTLETCGGESVSLASLLEESPVVLSFFRGRWCGYDTRELQYLQKVHAKINEHGARLISLSPALPENLRLVKKEYNLSFDILRDVENRVAEQFGLTYPTPDLVLSAYEAGGIFLDKENGEDSFRIALPSTFVISQEGNIVLAFYHPDYTRRLEPADIISFLKDYSTTS